MGAGERIGVGLAFEVVATFGTKKETVIGTVMIEGTELGSTPRDLSRLDLASVVTGEKPVTAALRLRPSAQIAYRHPSLTEYWGQEIQLGKVTFAPRE